MTGNKIAIPLSGKSFKTRLRGMLFALLSCLPSSCQGVYQVSDFRQRCVCSFIINSRVVLWEAKPQANESVPRSLSACCWGWHSEHGAGHRPAPHRRPPGVPAPSTSTLARKGGTQLVPRHLGATALNY